MMKKHKQGKELLRLKTSNICIGVLSVLVNGLGPQVILNAINTTYQTLIFYFCMEIP